MAIDLSKVAVDLTPIATFVPVIVGALVTMLVVRKVIKLSNRS